MCTANLVAKLGEDANNAIESQAKKVEALGSKADLTEDNASKMVEDTGRIKLCMVIIHSCHNVFAYRWFSLYVIAAMLVDENKRSLITPFVCPPAIAHYIIVCASRNCLQTIYICV